MLCANFVAIRWGTAEIHYLERQGLNEEMKVLLQNIISRLAGYARRAAQQDTKEASLHQNIETYIINV